VSTRLTLLLLCSLLLAPAAFAAGSATGDGVLELKAVNGKVGITGQRGAIWGQLDKGTLRVVDLNPDDNLNAYVSGCAGAPGTDPGVTIYICKNIHFRFIGGKYRFTIIGSGIDVTAVGVGQASLTGDPEELDTGDYKIDDGKWVSVPYLKKPVTFGTPQPVASP
jgi:hypothetical protein